MTNTNQQNPLSAVRTVTQEKSREQNNKQDENGFMLLDDLFEEGFDESD